MSDQLETLLAALVFGQMGASVSMRRTAFFNRVAWDPA